MAEEMRDNDLSLAEVFKTNSITGFRFKQFNYKYFYATKKTILSRTLFLDLDRNFWYLLLPIILK